MKYLSKTRSLELGDSTHPTMLLTRNSEARRRGRPGGQKEYAGSSSNSKNNSHSSTQAEFPEVRTNRDWVASMRLTAAGDNG